MRHNFELTDVKIGGGKDKEHRTAACIWQLCI